MMDADEDHEVFGYSWPICAYQNEEDNSQCSGRKIAKFNHCLAHLQPEDLDQFLREFGPGVDLDASGTIINAALLERVLYAAAGGHKIATFGVVDFTQALFTDHVDFALVRFNGGARFQYAQFRGGR